MKRVVSVLIAFMLFCVSLHADAPVAPTNGLVAFYPFSGSAIDAGPLRNDGTVHGATLSSDRFGRATSAARYSGAGLVTVRSRDKGSWRASSIRCRHR